MARPAVGQPSTAPDFPVALRLTRWADGRVARLLSLRPDLREPAAAPGSDRAAAPPDLVELAVRAGAIGSVEEARRRLDEFSLQVLDALCLLAEPASVAAVAALFDGQVEVADVERALEGLEDRALAFGDEGNWYRQPALRHLVAEPAGLAPPLAAVYRTHSGVPISGVAERLGVPPGRTVAATRDAVAEYLSQPDVVRALLDSAPSGAAALAGQLAAGPPIVVSAYELYSPSDRTPVGWLLRHGLIVAEGWDSAVMPREVAVALRGGTPFPTARPRRPTPAPPGPPGPPAVHPGDTVERTAADRALRLVRDVVTLVDDLASTPPRLLKGGGLGVRDVRRLARGVGRGERDTARLLELAQVAGLVAADWATGTVTPQSRYDDWLALDSPGRWGWLVTSWLRLPGYLSSAGAVVGSGRFAGKVAPPLAGYRKTRTARRQRVLLLDALAAGGTRDAIIDVVLWDEPLLWGDPLGDAACAELPRVLAGWVWDEAELFGLAVDDRASPAGRLLAERGPDGVEAAVAALRQCAPPVVESFVLQADLTAVVSGELAHQVRLELGLLADVESVGAGAVYRFSAASLRRGFDAGRTAEDIASFLDCHASHGVPQPLAYLVADLGRRFGQLRTGAVTCYLRAESPALLAEVLRGAKTARLGLRQIAPTVLVGSAEPATVLATLRAAGYLPALEDGDGALVITGPAPRRSPAPALPPQRRLRLVGPARPR